MVNVLCLRNMYSDLVEFYSSSYGFTALKKVKVAVAYLWFFDNGHWALSKTSFLKSSTEKTPKNPLCMVLLNVGVTAYYIPMNNFCVHPEPRELYYSKGSGSVTSWNQPNAQHCILRPPLRTIEKRDCLGLLVTPSLVWNANNKYTIYIY